MVHPDIEKVFRTAGEIHERVGELAEEIGLIYGDREIVALCVLTGGVLFFADLVRCLGGTVRLAFAKAASYHDGTRPGDLTVDLLSGEDLAGKDVLIVEDIVDTGRSLVGIRRALRAFSPRSVRTVVLLDKKARREVDVDVEFTGFTVPDEFLVGFGLDHAGRYRNLPYVGILRRTVYEGCD